MSKWQYEYDEYLAMNIGIEEKEYNDNRYPSNLKVK